ncbi:hypothetical protein [Nocardioides panaciterrulae]|uniref:Uncharacterized protein n=1 Tax=Nocardioides panaciterrulae TaxID=661492 RepID=A0A7Y9E9Y1_9ACTN|nr:hypothetical protein [Nocardioides panaciterrulae]NYD43924.1 hypothetical protein [Nocardioides panaciterrulae]NYD43993.1 hypothetical protein [Nocardioides panaciterrulae]
MPDFTVHRYGTDTSGRGIYLTAYMHDWWQAVVADLGFEPTIVQGAFMTRNGGGAAASAGYHDQGGCMDVRIWDLTGSQVDKLVRTIREHGGGAWRRDKTPQHGGMDPHCHITLGTDQPLSAGAAASWRSYLAGCNGLANNAPDYEWRPRPLVTTPPPQLEDDMPAYRDWKPEDKQAMVQDLLDADMNLHDPKGSPDFVGETVRSVLKKIAQVTGAVGGPGK